MSSPTLSTHVLDTAHGTAASGVSLALRHGDVTLFSGLTDTDGRCPALKDISLTPGSYSLTFAVAAYFRAQAVVLPEPPFLDEVTIAFGIAGDGHYHVPLLVSPFGYSTYRGS